MLSKLCFTGCQLICSGVVTADVNLTCNSRLFIAGTVYTPTGEPLPNAAIEIRIIDDTDPCRVIRVGVTFSLADGTYGVSLPKISGRQYQLLAFSPI